MTLLAHLGAGKGWRRVPNYPLVDSKFGRILELVRGKDVLDCGCVGSAVEDGEEIALTSHHQIARAARTCLGVDTWAEEIEKRRRAGYDVVAENVETMRLGRTFDAIVAADLIEHLANPGAFLDRASEHLRDGGLLCLVTPNAFSANVALKALLGVAPGVNPEHTCWYDPVTLAQLLRRHGFDPVEWFWQDYGRNRLVAALVRRRPNLAAHLICIAKRVDGAGEKA